MIKRRDMLKQATALFGSALPWTIGVGVPFIGQNAHGAQGSIAHSARRGCQGRPRADQWQVRRWPRQHDDGSCRQERTHRRRRPEKEPDADVAVVDLGGRTVIPGLFDAHVHYTRAGVNPGYEARRIERAFSIAELQEAIAQRAESVPPGAFITCIGGWNHTQFAEARRPTKAELDAAAPKHAVYISGTGGGTGAITNSLGRTFLAAEGVMVDEATGVVASAAAAVAALQAVQTPNDRLRGTADLNAHANSLGLTGVINAGNLADQEFALRLWRQEKLTIRMRPLFPADSPQEVEARVLNNFSQAGRAVGDDLFRVGRIRRANRRHRHDVGAVRADRPDDRQAWLAAAAALDHARRERLPSRRRFDRSRATIRSTDCAGRSSTCRASMRPG